MGMELRQQLKLSQQLIMTPQLQQAIKLLQLNRLELMDLITQEMKENPALEDMPEILSDEEKQSQKDEEDSESSELKEIDIEEKVQKEIDWDNENYLNEYNSAGKNHFESEKHDAPKFEAFTANKQDLGDHLLWQLLMLPPIEEEEIIGSIIIGNLNQDGYLDISIEEIVKLSGQSTFRVEDVLETMQTFDPIGVCAKSLSECLLIQAKHFGIKDKKVIEIIKNHIKNLENKNYKAIAKSLKINIKHVISAVNIIKNFEPKPGRKFNEEPPHYIIPDIYISKIDDEFIITMNDDGLPKLRINPYYRQAVLKNGKKIAADTKEYLNDKMRSATWLIKNIHQRQKTIYNVTKSILKFQKEFFENGITHLKPMVLQDVADDIGMHESTISRVTTNKYVYTPQGTFELKYFFNSSINTNHGDSIASTSVQDKIKKIVKNEDKKKPYTDKEIVEFLKNENVNIARRTISKYREILKILPSNKRKEY